MEVMGINRMSPCGLAARALSLTVPPPPLPPFHAVLARMNPQKALENLAENFDPHMWDTTQYAFKQPALKQPVVEAKKKPSKRWSKTDDSALTQAVQQIGEVHFEEPQIWEEVAGQLPGRTAAMCAQRWKVTVGPRLDKLWSKKEDSLILKMVKKYGTKSWSTIAKGLAGAVVNFDMIFPSSFPFLCRTVLEGTVHRPLCSRVYIVTACGLFVRRMRRRELTRSSCSVVCDDVCLFSPHFSQAGSVSTAKTDGTQSSGWTTASGRRRSIGSFPTPTPRSARTGRASPRSCPAEPASKSRPISTATRQPRPRPRRTRAGRRRRRRRCAGSARATRPRSWAGTG